MILWENMLCTEKTKKPKACCRPHHTIVSNLNWGVWGSFGGPCNASRVFTEPWLQWSLEHIQLSDPTEGHDPQFKRPSKEDSISDTEGWGQGGPEGAESLGMKPPNMTVLSLRWPYSGTENTSEEESCKREKERGKRGRGDTGKKLRPQNKEFLPMHQTACSLSEG